MFLLLALLIGVVAGLRSATAPAAVSWGAWLGWLPLGDSWASFMGHWLAVAIFTIAALAEFVGDQLPSTPSRKVPQQFGARLVSGALSGAALGTVGLMPIVGLIAGVAGAAAGTLGGAELRRMLAKSIGSDLPAGLIEDAVAIVAALLDRVVGVVSRRFDAIIVGTGQAGPPLAGRLTAAGMTVAIVERKHVGGTCVNTGCKPTKTMVASAYAAHMARRAADFGVKLGGGTVGVDMKAVKARKDAVALGSRKDLETWLAGMEKCTFLRGHARLASPRSVTVDGETLEAERIFLNVGGRAAGAGPAGNRPDLAAHQHLDPRARYAAGASGGGRRQLYRPRIRPDVPPLRKQRHGDREGAAADRAGGRGRFRRHSRLSRGRRHRGAACRRVHPLCRTPGRRHRRRRLRDGRAGSDRQPCAAGDGAASQYATIWGWRRLA